jgi:hypothetical protein
VYVEVSVSNDPYIERNRRIKHSKTAQLIGWMNLRIKFSFIKILYLFLFPIREVKDNIKTDFQEVGW